MRGLTGLWLLALLAAGCARAPVAIPTEPMEAYAFRQTQGGVRVAVDPFFTVERTRGAFHGGEEFAEKGLLPVRAIIENASPGDITVNPRDFQLVRPSGQTEVALSTYDAFARVRIPVGWWGLGAGVVGGSVPAYRNEARLKDIEARELRETLIPAGTSASGFVYFALPENELNLAGSRVVFPLRGPGNRELIYEIPIAGRRDIPMPFSAPQAVGRDPHPTPPPERGREREGGSGATTPSGPTRTEGTGGRGVIIRSPAE
ncbi:MAG: hypothetical protein HY803_10235 [candidate division NC10 bacterium]|nr:hypothetical protein [candidate division NC10 bacterium]